MRLVVRRDGGTESSRALFDVAKGAEILSHAARGLVGIGGGDGRGDEISCGIELIEIGFDGVCFFPVILYR